MPGAVAVALLVASCGSVSPTAPVDTAGRTAQPTAGPPAVPTATLASPAPTTGTSVPPASFAFDAESVLGYYQTIDYTCAGPVPGPVAGSTVRSCQLLDPDGRLRVIGLTIDPAGNLVAGFASMRATPGEAFLDPTVALEPLAGFVGAMLGEVRGTELVPWLAGHLGDSYAETASGDLAVLAHTQETAGQAVLFVEVATEAYRSARPRATG